MCLLRSNHLSNPEQVFVILSFEDELQLLVLVGYSCYGFKPQAKYCDLYRGTSSQYDGCITLRGGQFSWLSEI